MNDSTATPSWLGRVGGWCFDHRRRAVAVWAGVVLVVFVSAGVVGPAFGSGSMVPGSDSEAGFAALEEHFPELGTGGQSGTIVIRAEQGVDDPEVVRAVEALFATVDAGFPDEAGVPRAPGATVVSPYDDGGAVQVATSGPLAGRLAFASVHLSADVDDTESGRIGDLIAEEAPRIDGLEVLAGGQYLATVEPPQSELIGVAFAVVVLIVAFGSVLAMGLPIAVAIGGVGIGIGSILLLTRVATVPEDTLLLGMMVGLGVGIDYALSVHAGGGVRRDALRARRPRRREGGRHGVTSCRRAWRSSTHAWATGPCPRGSRRRRRFGGLDAFPFGPPGGNPFILEISHGRRNPGTENGWHSDVTWMEEPSLGSIAQLVEAPPTGGATLFADSHAAFLGLPPETRERVRHLDGTNDYRISVQPGGRNVMPDELVEQIKQDIPFGVTTTAAVPFSAARSARVPVPLRLDGGVDRLLGQPCSAALRSQRLLARPAHAATGDPQRRPPLLRRRGRRPDDARALSHRIQPSWGRRGSRAVRALSRLPWSRTTSSAPTTAPAAPSRWTVVVDNTSPTIWSAIDAVSARSA